MNRKKQNFVLALSAVAASSSFVAFWVLDRRQAAAHTKRMVNLERETQNIREYNESLKKTADYLDSKIEAAKFWLIVTETD